MIVLKSLNAATEDRQKAVALLTELQVVIQKQQVVACLTTVNARLWSALFACKATRAASCNGSPTKREGT